MAARHCRQWGLRGREGGPEAFGAGVGLTHQAMHDAHAVGVHCERLLVQLLGLLQAALHLGQPAPHVEYRV